jgi:hypothetical protein
VDEGSCAESRAEENALLERVKVACGKAPYGKSLEYGASIKTKRDESGETVTLIPGGIA